MLSIPRTWTPRTWTPRRFILAGLALTALSGAGLLNVAVADEPRSPAEVTDQDIPLLGLSTQFRLGLPAVEPDALYEYYPYWAGRHWSGRRWYSPYYPRFGGPYWSWYPWDGAPQTIKRKRHADTLGLAQPPRLGLHYQYPGAYQLGLRIPAAVGEDAVEYETPYRPYSPVVSEALALLKNKRYADAGRILSTEIKDGVATLETYMVIVEVLAANGKYAAAARILLHGIQVSDDLRALDTMAVRDHFPSPESFDKALEEIDDAVTKAAGNERARLELLRATFLLFSGDPVAMTALEGLQSASTPVSTSAKRLYMHFVDRLFEEEEEKPEATPVPPEEGKGEGSANRGDEV